MRLAPYVFSTILICLFVFFDGSWEALYQYKSGLINHAEIPEKYFLVKFAFGFIKWYSTSPHLVKDFNLPHDWPGPIDVVYTWVNGSEPQQRAALQKVKLEHLQRKHDGDSLRYCNSTERPEIDNCVPDDATENRFQDNEELRYSMRSLFKFSPWVRNVYLVTNGQVPSWLNLDHPRLKVIRHDQIFLNSSHLPTFSSPAIEANLHRIPGLSRHWIYLNDDVMFGAPIYPDDFISLSRGQRIYLSWPVPDCSPGCVAMYLKDGICDQACNVSSCGWDLGDCLGPSVKERSSWWSSPSQSSDCAESCPNGWLGDKVCDRNCNKYQCGMDLGDCGVEKVVENLHGFSVQTDGQVFSVQRSQFSVYFNLSHVIHAQGTANQSQNASTEGQLDLTSISERFLIVDAVHNNSNAIQTSIILQKEKMLILVFNKKGNLRNTTTFMLKFRDTTLPLPQHNQSAEHEIPYTHQFHFHLQYFSLSYEALINATLTKLKEEEEKTRLAWAYGHRWDSPDDDNSSTTKMPTNATSTGSSITAPTNQSAPSVGDSDFSANESSTGLTPFQKFFGSFTKYKGRRKLIDEPLVQKPADHYGASLAHVNNLLNQAFGPAQRYVPAHMAHFIQSDVVENMMKFWSKEWEKSSSAQLRSPEDMQYALAYYYFMASHFQNVTIEQIFTSVDRDGDGTLIVQTYDVVFEQPEYVHAAKRFYSCMDGDTCMNCSQCNRSKTDCYLQDIPYFGTNWTECDKTDFNCTNCTNCSSEGTCDSCQECLNLPPDPPPFNASNVTQQNATQRWCSLEPGSPAIYLQEECERFKALRENKTLHLLDDSEPCPILPPLWCYWESFCADNSFEFACKDDKGVCPTNTTTNSTVANNTTNSTVANNTDNNQTQSPLQSEWYNTLIEPPELQLSFKQLLLCPDLVQLIHHAYNTKPNLTSDIVKDSPSVGFVMVGTNHTDVRRAIDGIRREQHKFICLNDNMDHSNPEAANVVKVLVDFYSSLVPNPSPFELQNGTMNPFRYMDELQANL